MSDVKKFELTPEQFSTAIADALESGNYRQGTGRLVGEDDRGPTYCCLGVACMVYIENGGELEVEIGGKAFRDPLGDETGDVTQYNYLPGVVAKALGTYDRDPRLTKEGLDLVRANKIGADYASCAGVNDYGADFKLIAQIFRRRLYFQSPDLSLTEADLQS